MSTRKETVDPVRGREGSQRPSASNGVEFILEKLGEPRRFSVRAMFGEYALYADGKVVGLVCNDQLYVKILPASEELENICEKDEAYPGSKKFYVVEEELLMDLTKSRREVGTPTESSGLKNLPEILIDIAKSLPEKKKKITT